jgi:hypothetical protein
VVLDRQLDVSRGDWLGTPGSVLPVPQRFAPRWPGWTPSPPARPQVLVRHGHRWVQARCASIGHRLDIHTLQPTDAHEPGVNDIGEVEFELQQPLPLEPYAHNRVGGALIVVDPASHRTSGALLVNEVALMTGRCLHRRRPGRRRPDHPARRRLLAEAEVVLFDALTDPALRDWLPGAWIDVGKRGFGHATGSRHRRAAGALAPAACASWCG